LDEEMEDNCKLGDKQKYVPYKFSGKNFTFEQAETEILDGLRGWAHMIFKDQRVIPNSMFTYLSKIKDQERNDFDLLCKVMKVAQKDDHNYAVRIKDVSKEVWNMTVSNLRYPLLKEGNIIRVRSASIEQDSDAKNILLRMHSNILKFISESKIVEEMQEQITDDSDKDKLLHDGEFPRNPVILTETDAKFAEIQTTRLRELSFDEEEAAKLKEDYKLSVSVVSYEPQEVREIVQAYCEECSTNFSLKGSDKKSKKKDKAEVYKCEKCKGECELVYMIRFFTKDPSVQRNAFLYSLLLYSKDGMGAEFFNDKPKNLYIDKEARENV
jgi:hypothetical protein